MSTHEFTETLAGYGNRLLPFSQARTLVGLSRSKIYELMADGDFPPPVKIGRCNYFSAIEIQAWIAEQLGNRVATLRVR